MELIVRIMASFPLLVLLTSLVIMHVTALSFIYYYIITQSFATQSPPPAPRRRRRPNLCGG
uniref:Uncharacterized protein n=1 Tax=Abalone asfa-like virus TaxID=2839893 RepID=A0A5K7XYI8_9VIRU|nr:hypothetical protein [Abalone asfa-like virus]